MRTQRPPPITHIHFHIYLVTKGIEVALDLLVDLLDGVVLGRLAKVDGRHLVQRLGLAEIPGRREPSLLLGRRLGERGVSARA